tara:strand:- start:2117 stop:3193 length:1077 start_codon:yes stop_codon:yes gene_type:complete
MDDPLGFKKHLAQIVWIFMQVLNFGSNIDFFVKVQKRENEGSLNNDLLYFYSLYILIISFYITYPLFYLLGKIIVLRHCHFLNRYAAYMIFFSPSYMLVALLVQQIPQMIITSFYLEEFELTYSFVQGILSFLVAGWEIYSTVRNTDLGEVQVPEDDKVKELFLPLLSKFNFAMFSMLLSNAIFGLHPLYMFAFWYARDVSILENRSSLPIIIVSGIMTILGFFAQMFVLSRSVQRRMFEGVKLQLESQDMTNMEASYGKDEEEDFGKALKYCCISCFSCILTCSALMILIIYVSFSFSGIDLVQDPVARTTILINFIGFIITLILACIISCIGQICLANKVAKQIEMNELKTQLDEK